MIYRKVKHFLHFLAILALVGLGNPSALTAGRTFQVEFSGSKLTVNVDNITLGVLLERIQEETGVAFTLDKGESRKTISVAFQGLPLDTAIRRILRTSNHAMVFSPAGALERVIVTGEGGKRSSLAENQIDQAAGTSRLLAKAPVSREDTNAAYAPVDPATQMLTPQRNPLKQVTDPEVAESPTMQITTPSDQMVVESRSDVRMEISRASTPMRIKDGVAQRMKITAPQSQNLPK